MATTFTKIASVSVGILGASSIDFTSISSSYTDLCLKYSTLASGLGIGLKLTLNGSSSSFTNKYLEGSGSAAASGSNAQSGQFVGVAGTSSVPSNAELYIPNYAGSNNKSVSIDSVQEANTTLAYADLVALLWSNTAAITSVGLTLASGTFVQYSTATLYGISKS